MNTVDTVVNEKDLLLELTNTCEDYEWEDSVHTVQTIMNRLRIKNWFVYGFNLTWQNIAGYKYVQTHDAQTFLNKISPNGEWKMKIYKNGRSSIRVVNYHHDKPMGETMYAVSVARAVREKLFERIMS